MVASDRLRILSERVLSDAWATLKSTRIGLRRRDGAWQEMTLETYDHGDGVAVLPLDRARRTVLLVRQFRYPAFINGEDGMLIEAAAGKLDGAAPADRIRAEAEEELGYALRDIRQVLEAYSSPGSLTERLHLFLADYTPDDQISDGGGLRGEGEDIEVLELDFDAALAAVASRAIRDAKTILLLQHAALTVFRDGA